MKVNRLKMMKLIEVYCEGNYSKFGRAIGVDTSHLHRFLNTGVGGGRKIMGGLFKFCKTNQLDFEEYIDF